MTKPDNYLWDRSGEPDPTVQKLEQVLSGLAHYGRELEFGEPSTGRVVRRWPWMLAAAAGLTAAFFVLWPDIELHEGSQACTFTADKKPLTVKLGKLAEITLEPGSELRFEHWQQDTALFRLKRGALTAWVEPPPAVAPDFFLIDTSLGRVTDKGCRYELSIERDGTNVVDVIEGAVTFSFGERTVYVPAGAGTQVTARGPSTPLFDDCLGELRKAVEEFDMMRQKFSGKMLADGVVGVTEACTEPRDSLVLWHLLRDDDELVRELAEAALLDLVGEPEPVTTKGPPTWPPEIWLPYLQVGAWTQAR